MSGDWFEDLPPEAATRCDKSSIDSDDAARRENVVGGSAMTSVRDHDGSSALFRFSWWRLRYSATFDCGGNSFRTASRSAASFLIGV